MLVALQEYVDAVEVTRQGLSCEEQQFRTAICSFRNINPDAVIHPSLHLVMHNFERILVRGPSYNMSGFSG